MSLLHLFCQLRYSLRFQGQPSATGRTHAMPLPTMHGEARREAAQRLRDTVTSLAPSVRHLTYAEFCSLESPVLLDVRSSGEMAAGTLSGAVSAAEAPPVARRPVVAFCTVGLRSAAYARVREGVYSYSVMEHVWGGGTLQRPDGQEWGRRVHTYTERYQGVFPEWVKGESYQGWSVVANVLNDIPALVGMFAAWGWRGVSGGRQEGINGG